MKTDSLPTAIAIRAACAVDPITAGAFIHPENYAIRLDTGEPSTYPAECKAEILAMASKIDTATELLRLLTLLDRATSQLQDYCTEANGDLNDSLAEEIRATVERLKKRE